MKTATLSHSRRPDAPTVHTARKPPQPRATEPAAGNTTSQDAGAIEYRSWLELLWAQRAAASAG